MSEEQLVSKLKVQTYILIGVLIGLVIGHRFYTHSNNHGETLVVVLEQANKGMRLCDRMIAIAENNSPNESEIMTILDSLKAVNVHINENSISNELLQKLYGVNGKSEASNNYTNAVERSCIDYSNDKNIQNRSVLVSSIRAAMSNFDNIGKMYRTALDEHLQKIEQHHKYDLPIFVVIMGLACLVIVFRFNKKIQQQLHRHKQVMEHLHLLSIVAEKTNNTVIITDTNVRIRWVNHAFEQQTGYTLKDVEGHRPAEFLLNDNADKNTILRMREALQLKQSFNGEVLSVNKWGKEYWSQIQTDPIYDESNNHIGFVVVEFDITEHRKTQENIKATAQLLEHLMDNIVAGVYVEDDTLTVTYINDKFLTLFKTIPQKETILNHNSESIHNYLQQYFESPTEYRENVETIIGQRYTVNDELLFLVDGRYIERTYIPFEPQTGKPWAMWMFRDVTQRLQSEAMLRKNEAMLRKAQELAKMASFESPATGGKDYWSKNPGIAFGYNHDIAIETINLQTLVTDEVYTMIIQVWNESIREKKSFDIDFPIVHKDGSVHYVRCIGEPVYDEKGNYREMLGIVQNITEKKLAEIAVMEAKEESDRANRAKSAFLSSMTHELRTPLNAIIGFSQILENDTSITDKQREFVTAMYKSGQHLLTMINDVLDISKIEANKLDLVTEPCNIAMEIDDIASVFSLRCHQKNVHFTLHKDNSIPYFILCDKKRVRQILINLLGNSIKFTNKGYVQFSVTVHDMYEQDATAYVTLRFDVKDSGRGISEDRLQTIFEPFTQADSLHSEGTGLGLAITSRIVKAMKGTLTVHSTVNVGSEFSVFLPFAVAEETISDDTTPAEFVVRGIEKKQANHTALLVDDIESNLLVHQALLRRVGFDCVLANNAETALYLAEYKHPDVIILDIMMPGKNGVEIMSEIRSQSWGKDVPIIALTANGKAYTRDEMLSKGFSEFVVKPFPMEQLFAAIESTTGITFIREKKNSRPNSSLNKQSEIVNIKNFILSLNDTVRCELEEYIEFQFFEKIEKVLTDIQIKSGDPHYKAYRDLVRYSKDSNVAMMLKITDVLKNNS